MSTIFFMAVQCCQCSTMQVKQRKKTSNSNKWLCVVCNQRQSIRKVFAEASMAKDLRSFVQSFNISRSSKPPPMAEPLSSSDSKKRPRSDWTDFLDPDDQASDPEPKSGGGFDFGPEIVTESPVKMTSSYKRNLTKRAQFFNENGEEEEEEKPSKCRLAEVSKWSQYVTWEDINGVGVGVGEFAGPADDWKSLINEEKVEDDEVHPDFL